MAQFNVSKIEIYKNNIKIDNMTGVCNSDCSVITVSPINGYTPVAGEYEARVTYNIVGGESCGTKSFTFPVGGILTIHPMSLEWEYNDETYQIVTFNKGEGVRVTDVNITGTSKNKFEITSIASNEIYVKPKGTNTGNEPYNAELRFTYNVNGGSAQYKNVQLKQKANSGGGCNCDGHDYVEIGGIKWATMNVGANSITDTGLYFQWGDTQGYTASQVGSGSGKKYFGEDDYKYANGGTMTKYNDSDGKTVLDTSDDAVAAAWGGSWRTPKKEEFEALKNAVNAVWTGNYNNTGTAGLVCTSKSDSSKVLFFPNTNNYPFEGVMHLAMNGMYWSSTRSTYIWTAHNFDFAENIIHWDLTDRYYFRCAGLHVRGVCDCDSPTPPGPPPSTEHKVDLTYVNGSPYICYCDGNAWLTVDNVRSNASESYENIKTAVVGDCVCNISVSAFSGCTNLTNVTVSNSVTGISDSAFTNCVSLTSCTLGNSVRAIQGYGFAHCTSLSNITFPSSLVGIGKFGFTECSNIKSLTFPENFVELNQHAFYNCTKLESVDMSRSKTDYIGTSAFEGCTALTSVTMSNTLTEIFQSAFHTCIGLRSVTIPSTVTNISNFAFLRCYHLEKIICEPTTPPHLGGGPFPKDGEILCTIYVPDESYNDYINDESWSTYVNDGMVKKKSEMPT